MTGMVIWATRFSKSTDIENVFLLLPIVPNLFVIQDCSPPENKDRLRARWSSNQTPKLCSLIQLPVTHWVGDIKDTANQDFYYSSQIQQDWQKENKQTKTNTMRA